MDIAPVRFDRRGKVLCDLTLCDTAQLPARI